MKLLRVIGVAVVLSFMAQGCATVSVKQVQKKNKKEPQDYNESFALWDEGQPARGNSTVKQGSD